MIERSRAFCAVAGVVAGLVLGGCGPSTAGKNSAVDAGLDAGSGRSDAGSQHGGTGGRDGSSAGKDAEVGASDGSVDGDAATNDGAIEDDGATPPGEPMQPAACGPIFVQESSTAKKPDGLSWTKAYRELTQALADAHDLLGSGDCTRVEVWAAAGTYTPAPSGMRAGSFVLEDGLQIYGGFSGDESARKERDWAAHETILSGDLNRDDDATAESTADNAYQVVTASFTDDSAVLDGVVVERGHADGPFPKHLGAGLYLKASDARLVNLTVRTNTATQDGGGIYLDQGDPQMSHVTLSANHATRGGGMYAHTSTPKLRDVTIDSCIADLDGGGIYNDQSDMDLADSKLSLNVVRYGTGDGHGGGMYNADSDPVLRNTRFQSNQVMAQSGNNFAVYGGAIYNASSHPRILDCQFYDNQVQGLLEADAGAIYNDAGSSTQVARSAFQGNVASANGNGVTGGIARGGAVLNHGGSLEIVNSTFIQNEARFSIGAGSGGAAAYGGAVYNQSGDIHLVNVAMFLNTINESASGLGPSAALYAESGTVEFIHSTVVDNNAISAPVDCSMTPCGGGAIHGAVSFINSVYWGDSIDDWLDVSEVKSSCVQNGNYDETNPSETNRDDCNVASLDIPSDSSAVDHGDDTLLPADSLDLDDDGDVAEPLPVDLNGAARVVGSSVDMGAYELQ